VLYGGTVVETKLSDQLFEEPSHPYSQGLLASIPDVHGQQRAAANIDGPPPDLLRRPVGCIFQNRCPERIELCSQQEPKLNAQQVACHRR
jgi:peptide/nickel transport system ATP-binding protein